MNECPKLGKIKARLSDRKWVVVAAKLPPLAEIGAPALSTFSLSSRPRAGESKVAMTTVAAACVDLVPAISQY